MPPQLKQQTVTSLARRGPSLRPQEAYIGPEIVTGARLRADDFQTVAIYRFRQTGSRNAHFEFGMAVASFSSGPTETAAISFNRALAENLCAEHPDISTDPGIFGGNPHINNVRLTVGNILGKLYHYGSIKAVADIYAPHVSESQIKEAIAYAQDFLEEAIHAGEPS